MSLSSAVDALATRIGQEFKAVRAEIVSALTGKASVTHAATHGSGGTDPVTPAAIGAATTGHSHAAAAPAVHAASHASGGSDPVTPAAIGAADAIHAARHAAGGLDPVTPGAIGAMPTLTPTGVKTTDYTAVAGDLVLVAPASLQTITLPAAVVGARVGVKRTTASNANNTRIQAAGSDAIVNSTATPIWVRLQDEFATLRCWATGQWVVELHGLPSGSLTGYAVLTGDARVTADQAAATASIRTLGTGTQQAAAGNDSRITGAQQASAKGQASGYAGLDSGAKVPIGQLPVGGASGLAQLDTGGLLPQAVLPAIALTEFLGAVASQAAMLALTGQRGDWCTRTDLGVDYQLIAEPSSTLASWRAMTYPASPVSSVNGRTGPVTGLAEAADVATALGGKLDTTAAPELIRDTIGTALVQGSGVTITVNDAGDTITIAATGGGGAVTSVNTRTGAVTGLAEQATLAVLTALTRDELTTDWSTKPDGAIPATGDEGAPMVVVKDSGGTATPTISGGGVVLAGAGAIYLNQALPSGKKTRRLGGAFSFPAAGTTGGEAFALCAWVNTGISPQQAHIHIAVGRDSWAVQTYNAGATLIKSGSFVPQLSLNREYRVEAVVFGDTLCVALPDGTYVEAVHASVASITGLVGGTEIVQTATSATVKIVRQWADSRPDRPGSPSDARAGQLARRGLPWYYDETTGNLAWKAAPAAWAELFVAGLIAANDFYALSAAPTLDAHLTRMDWVRRQVLGTVTAIKTGAYTAVPGELVMVDATAGPITITLPAQSGGGPVKVKKTDASANAVTIQRAGTDTIGTQAATSTTLVTQYQIVEFRPSVTAGNWAITGGQLSITGLDARYRGPAKAVSAAASTSIDITGVSKVSLTCTGDTAISFTGTPYDGQTVVITCLASGAQRIPAVFAGAELTAGVTSRALTIPSAKKGRFVLQYSTFGTPAWSLDSAYLVG